MEMHREAESFNSLTALAGNWDVKLTPPDTQILSPLDDGWTLPVTLLCGRVLEVPMDSPTATVEEVKMKLLEIYGIPSEIVFLMQGTRHLAASETINMGENSLKLHYNLRGAGPVNFSTTFKFPEVCNLRCLCFKYGCKECPNITKDNLCESTCCCCFEDCGLKDCAEQQCLCVLINKGGIKTDTSLPGALRCRILLWKCGIKDFPNLAKDDWCYSNCLCLHEECGLKEWPKNQLFCLKCDFSSAVSNVA
mmetsp:Transcript_26976/g.37245  ORF Transcript_26976/g.37245 Transcript_26976/m.37245 type:complete len:250 (+) Transcript_26976:213-962(+)